MGAFLPLEGEVGEGDGDLDGLKSRPGRYRTGWEANKVNGPVFLESPSAWEALPSTIL